MFGIGMIAALVTMGLVLLAYILDCIFGEDDPGDVCGDMRDSEDTE